LKPLLIANAEHPKMNETKTFSPTLSRPGQDLNPSQDVVQYLKDYARERPEVAALWCFGIGFVLGWKLKPW
jgi:hypothetical protein